MKRKQTLLSLMSCTLIAGSAQAAIVLNPSFESDGTGGSTTHTHWDINSTDGNGIFVNTLNQGFPTPATRTYKGVSGGDKDFSDLGNKYVALNSNATRSFSAVTDVFEDNGTTAQLISSGDVLSVTVALGNRDGALFPAQTTLHIGYLTVAEDLTTFVSLGSSIISEATLQAQADQQFVDYNYSTTVAGGSAAIGNQFAIRFDIATSSTTDTRQTAFDNIAVAVPEPSAALLGILGLGGMMVRRRRA